MCVGEVGVAALHPLVEVAFNEEVEDSVNTVCRDALPARARYAFSNVVGARRLAATRQRFKHAFAHRRPFLAGSQPRRFGGASSDERRVRKYCFGRCRTRWSAYPSITPQL